MCWARFEERPGLLPVFGCHWFRTIARQRAGHRSIRLRCGKISAAIMVFIFVPPYIRQPRLHLIGAAARGAYKPFL